MKYYAESTMCVKSDNGRHVADFSEEECDECFADQIFVTPMEGLVDTREGKKVRWCETHDCEHYLKDACTHRMISLERGRPGGAVNLGEQMDGPKECVEGWRMVTRIKEKKE